MGFSMEVTTKYIEYIVELAKEIESEDPIDWGYLAIDEENAYRLMAANVIDMLKDKYDQPDGKDVILATIVKLVVENFVLNLKLKAQG